MWKAWAVVLGAAALIALGPILVHDLFVWLERKPDPAKAYERQQQVGSDDERANRGEGPSTDLDWM